MQLLGSGTLWRVIIYDPESGGSDSIFFEDAEYNQLKRELDKEFVWIRGERKKSSFITTKKVTNNDTAMHCLAELGENKKRFFSSINADEMDETKIRKSLYDFLLHLYFDRVLVGEIYQYKAKEGITIGQRTMEFMKSQF